MSTTEEGNKSSRAELSHISNVLIVVAVFAAIGRIVFIIRGE